MTENIIPPKLTVDPTSYGAGQKVPFIKGIRGYTGMDLKEAKDASEEQTPLVLRRRTVRDPELESRGVALIKSAGVVILSGGVQPVIDHLEEAVRAALNEGYYDMASDILNILKGFK